MQTATHNNGTRYQATVPDSCRYRKLHPATMCFVSGSIAD